MRSKLYIGEIRHARLAPVAHRFVYPAYYVALDLAELPALGQSLSLFGYNRIRAVTLYDRDYLGAGEGTITGKLQDLLPDHDLADHQSRVVLVTCPRHLCFGFNPINLFLVYQNNGALRCVVAEVHNTYGEAHVYILRESLEPRPGFEVRYQAPKAFFVSPFNDMKGDYEFQIAPLGDQLHVRVDLHRDGEPVLMTELQGAGRALNRWTLVRSLVRFPCNAALAAPRIAWQAIQLQRQGLRPRMKPKPSSPMTMHIGRPLLIGRWWGG